jgi:hypothetical protein
MIKDSVARFFQVIQETKSRADVSNDQKVKRATLRLNIAWSLTCLKYDSNKFNQHQREGMTAGAPESLLARVVEQVFISHGRIGMPSRTQSIHGNRIFNDDAVSNGNTDFNDHAVANGGVVSNDHVLPNDHALSNGHTISDGNALSMAVLSPLAILPLISMNYLTVMLFLMNIYFPMALQPSMSRAQLHAR